MIGPIVEFSDLQQLSGYQRLADVQKWADANGVSVRACRGGLWTTLNALDRALGLDASTGAPHYPSFD